MKKFYVRESRRSDKIANVIHMSISKFFNDNLGLPLSISGVLVTKDLKNAKVMVFLPISIDKQYHMLDEMISELSRYIDDDVLDVIEKKSVDKIVKFIKMLNATEYVLRSHLAKDVYLKYVPNIRFNLDDGVLMDLIGNGGNNN